MKRTKKLSLAVLCLLLILAASGCNASNPRQPEQNPEEPEKAEAEKEEPADEVQVYYLSESVPAENFEYSIREDGVPGAQIVTLKNISDQDYSYLQADVLFYNSENQLIDGCSSLISFSNLMAGTEQITRIAPALNTSDYDHFELLFSGDKIDASNDLDTSRIRIEEETQRADGSVIAKCVNDTGRDLSSVVFLANFYKGEEKVATNYMEYGLMAKDRIFLTQFEAPYDAWYNALPADTYDRYELEVIRVTALE